ncbi:MAG: hypothetical protein ACLQDQ_05665 [Myxococcaceae bacterium]
MTVRAKRVVWALLCLVTAVGTGWTIAVFFGGPFPSLIDSDAAVPALLAAQMLKARAWVPSSWYYVNDEFWLLSPQLFVLPFVWAWGVCSRALVAGNVLGLCVSGACVFLLSQRMTGSRAAAFVIALGLLAPFAQLQRDVVYVQLAYGWIFAYLCLLLYLAVRMTEANVRTIGEVLARKRVWVYSVLVVLLFAGNTARGLIYWLVPVLGVSLFEARSQKIRPQFLALAMVSAAAATLGTVVHFILRAGRRIQAWDAIFRTTGHWGHKLEAAWQGLPLLLGTPPYGGSDWFTPQGSLAAVRVAFFAAAAAVLVLVWRRTEGTPPAFGARVASLLLASGAIALVVSRMAVSPLSIRYFLPPALLALVTLLGACARHFGPRSLAFFAVAVLFAAGFSGGGALRTATLASAPLSNCGGLSRLCTPLAVARANGLNVGFSTYWNANASTLASRGNIRVCPISPDPPLKPERWLTSDDCFSPESYRAGFFVLVGTEGRVLVETGALISALGLPNRRESAGDMELWLYDASPKRDWSWLSL